MSKSHPKPARRPRGLFSATPHWGMLSTAGKPAISERQKIALLTDERA